MVNQTPPTTLCLPFREKAAIQKQADLLRQRFGQIDPPIDVDLLIEDMGIQLIPVPGIRRRISQDACVYRDWTVITYDQDAPERRLRFSLAHEVGHIQLHRERFDALPVADTIESAIGIFMDLPHKVWQDAEWQANYFASSLLMPSDQLAEAFEGFLGDVQGKILEAVNAGLRRPHYIETVVDRISSGIADRFGVSLDAAKTRLRMDEWVNQIP